MKTFTIKLTEEQLRLIRKTCRFTLYQNGRATELTAEESDELNVIAEMVLDTIEGEFEELQV